MSEFLDTVARTFAEHMPRRRALRVLGAALVGAAVPAVRARAANTTHDCPAQGAFLCKCPSINGLFFRICCPGKEGELYTCDCKAPPEGHAACKPVKKKICGPDITNALEDALGRVKSEFAGWSSTKRNLACANLVTLPGAAISWDVKELGPGGREQFAAQNRPACSTCGLTVQVGNDCHYAGSVNYVVYGVMMRLCRDYLSKESSSFSDWFSQEEMLELIYIHKNQTGTQAANFQASNEWALTGYSTGSVRPTPPGDRKGCERCPQSYTGRGLTVRWFPYTIRPNP